MRTSTKRLLAAGLLGLVIGVVQIVGFAQRGTSNASVIGVWRITEVTFTGPNARTVSNPQPGLHIYTGRHYSLTTDTADKVRPELPAQGATDKQLAETFLPFTAQAGTYEIKGNELTRRPIAAKDPINVRPGRFATVTFRLEGNTLWLTGKASQDGPVANPTTTKLTRLE